PLQNGFCAGLQLLFGDFRRKTKVEDDFQLTWDDVGGASAAVNIGDLEAGGGKELIALIPDFPRQINQCRRGQVNGVGRQVRVGHMTLDTLHQQACAQTAAAAVFDNIPDGASAGRLTNDTPVDLLATLAEMLYNFDGAVNGRAFFIA